MKKLWLLLILTPFFAFSQDDAAKKITFAFIDNDARVFLNNGDTILSNEIPTANATKLIQEYQDNQLNYEENYDQRLVRIETVVSGIKTTVTKQAYIEAKGKNILALKKGDKIDMICMGTSNNVIYPSLVNCDFTTNYINKLKIENKEYIEKLANKNVKSKYIIGTLYQGFAEVLKSNDEFNNAINSATDMEAFLKSTQFANLLQSTSPRMQTMYTKEEIQKMPFFILPSLK